MTSRRSPRSARSPASSARASKRRRAAAGGRASIIAVVLASLALAACGDGDESDGPNRFSADRAMSLVQRQVAGAQAPGDGAAPIAARRALRAGSEQEAPAGAAEHRRRPAGTRAGDPD